MRLEDAKSAPRAKPNAGAQDVCCGRWNDLDYVKAAVVTSTLIAPAPFFWAPPLWILALMRPFRTQPSSTRSAACRD